MNAEILWYFATLPAVVLQPGASRPWQRVPRKMCNG